MTISFVNIADFIFTTRKHKDFMLLFFYVSQCLIGEENTNKP